MSELIQVLDKVAMVVMLEWPGDPGHAIYMNNFLFGHFHECFFLMSTKFDDGLKCLIFSTKYYL